MKKLTSLGVAALIALLAVVAMVGLQSPAQAYPDVQIDLSVNRQVLYGSQTFTATGSSPTTQCTWTIEWNGVVRQSAPTLSFSTTYTAPVVSRITKIPLHGTCEYTAPSARGAATWQRTIVITVLPASSAVSPPGGGGSDLPNTGGPNALFLAGGLVLLVSGAAAVTIARRRAEEAETRAFPA